MSVLSTKRPHFTLDDAYGGGVGPIERMPVKRMRTGASQAMSMGKEDLLAMELANAAHKQQQPQPQPQQQHTGGGALSSAVSASSVSTTPSPRQHRGHGKPTSPTLRSLDLSTYKSRLFTWDEVNRIVASAVREREDVLKKEYDASLQEKLAEQFESFTQFNHDYIHRQMKDSSFDYMV